MPKEMFSPEREQGAAQADFSRVTNWLEFFEELGKLTIVPGSAKVYTPKEIQNLTALGADPSFIPRVFGIRDAYERLRAQEKPAEKDAA